MGIEDHEPAAQQNNDRREIDPMPDARRRPVPFDETTAFGAFAQSR
jgi:hypothetical protein